MWNNAVRTNFNFFFSAILAIVGLGASVSAAAASILNVSYDPTRELYAQINSAFAEQLSRDGSSVTVRQSHAGSAKQARAVIDGLNADVVTLALGYDIDAIAQQGLLDPRWQSRLPNNSTPYYSTVVLLVRKGNPKNIHDWDDLARPGISVITTNPKTSGGARWNFLALWGYAQKHFGTADQVQAFATQVFRNVSVLDSGARAATSTFVQRGQGDVLIAWENEALLVEQKIARAQFEIIAPSISIRAEPPVALIDRNIERNGTRAVALAYLKFLYQPAAQELAARNYFRPIDAASAAKFASQFRVMPLLSIDQDFAGWTQAQNRFFSDGAIFDRVWEAAQRR
jgi:sulfate/thiosulfate transport system substrate-binding protein